MKLKELMLAVVVSSVLAVGVVKVLDSPVAEAHTGSPAPTFWSTGNTLTAQNLNDTIAHLHNTFSGNIIDANISTSASIQHSKLQFPALVPKAWAQVSAVCTGGGGAGTVTCTLGDSSRITSITNNGTTGEYRLNLAYQPTDVNFAIFVTSGTASTYCMVDTQATVAPHAVIHCRNDANAVTDTKFYVLVMDT